MITELRDNLKFVTLVVGAAFAVLLLAVMLRPRVGV